MNVIDDNGEKDTKRFISFVVIRNASIFKLIVVLFGNVVDNSLPFAHFS